MTTRMERMVRAIRDVEREVAHDVGAQSLTAFLRQARPIHFLLIPVIYSLIVPLALLDAWMTLYQWSCFPAYGIPRLRRGAYFVMDRRKLAYLNAIEKMHCTYCSYAVGLVTYALDIAAQTEQYWCPIKHARAIPSPHAHYHAFVDYGDAIGYHRELPALRQSLRDGRHPRHDVEPAPHEQRKAV
jgi:hypothetical protein